MSTKVYYIAVDARNSPIVESGRVPVFWRRKVAVEHFKDWKRVRIVRCTIDIWPK